MKFSLINVIPRTALKGTIGFESQGVGMGSMFFFELPLYSAECVTRDELLKSSKINLFSSTAAMSTSLNSSRKSKSHIMAGSRLFSDGCVDVAKLNPSSQQLENDMAVLSVTREDHELAGTSSVDNMKGSQRRNSDTTIFGHLLHFAFNPIISINFYYLKTQILRYCETAKIAKSSQLSIHRRVVTCHLLLHPVVTRRHCEY